MFIIIKLSVNIYGLETFVMVILFGQFGVTSLPFSERVVLPLWQKFLSYTVGNLLLSWWQGPSFFSAQLDIEIIMHFRFKNYLAVILYEEVNLKLPGAGFLRGFFVWQPRTTVPLKSVLPPSCKTRCSSPEPRLSSLDTQLSSLETRLSSCESFKKLEVHVRLLELLIRF